eukprot:6613948-Pyramimonas_sp.AAC.1
MDLLSATAAPKDPAPIPGLLEWPGKLRTVSRCFLFQIQSLHRAITVLSSAATMAEGGEGKVAASAAAFATAPVGCHQSFRRAVSASSHAFDEFVELSLFPGQLASELNE